VQPSALHDAVRDEQPEKLAGALVALRRNAAEAAPSLFALRYLAAMLDSLLAADTRFRAASPLRALWQSDALDPPAWLDAFAQRLTALQAQARSDADVSVPTPVQAALAAIRTRYAEPLSMAGIAEELHMNAAYLGQLVRRYTGETFHHRLLAARVGRACVLLRQTAQPVGEVALEVGFRDVDYFSQQFRGRMGMSPVAYRNAEAAGKGDTLAPHQ
jgi:AraC-like DNA-binding protein